MAAQARFNWEDPLLLEQQLTQEERMVRDSAARFAADKLAPRVLEAFRHEHTDPAIFREMGEAGLLGATLPVEYGGSALNQVSYGLIAREIERIDSGYRSMMSVQSSLVMLPIHAFGNEATRQKYLPGLASGQLVGCFGLTEPDHGSDPGAMVTRARKVEGGYRLSGSKMWITNSPIADVFVVWAKDDEGQIRGFVLEKGWPGLSAPAIHGKVSQLGALWHCMGCPGGRRVLLACRAAIHPRSSAVRPTLGGQPVDTEEAGRHADRNHSGSAGLPAAWAHEG